MASVLTESDVHWLDTLDKFNKNYQNWETDKEANKHFLTPQLYQRIDIVFQLIKRILQNYPPTEQNRAKVYKQIEVLSFLLGFAAAELGQPLENLTL